MSKAYPNYQNMSYYDYIQFVKGNEFFLQKLREVKPVVDDGCPESVYYMKQSGKLHKIYTQMEHEKELLKQNKNLFKKLSNTLSKRSSSNYLSNPYSTKLYIESKNFMEDFSKKNKGKRNYEENVFLDKKIKDSKSNYQVEEMEKDFEKILSYKKLISNKNSLFLESFSPSRSRTGTDFFSSKKSSRANILPKLSKVDLLDPKIKTTTSNFFKNKKTFELSSKNNLLLSSKNSLNNNFKESDLNSNDNNDHNIKSISDQLIKKESEKDMLKAHIPSQSPINFRNSNEEILEEITNINKDKEDVGDDVNLDNVLVQYNEFEQSKQQHKVDFEVRLPLESKQSIKNELNIIEDNDKIICNSNLNEANNELNELDLQTDNKTIGNKKTNENLQSKEDLNYLEENKNIEEVSAVNENLINENENEIPNNEDMKIAEKYNEAVITKSIGFAKTLENEPKENSLSNIKDSPNKNGNRTYLFSAKNRIVIDSEKKINDKIILQTEKQVEAQQASVTNENQNDEEKGALEKMRKLEEMELNDDLSYNDKKSSRSQNSKNYENFEIKNEIENNNEVIITATKSFYDDKTHNSKIVINENSSSLKIPNDFINLNDNIIIKDGHSIQNSFMKAAAAEDSTNNLIIINKDIKSEVLSEIVNENNNYNDNYNNEKAQDAEVQAVREENKNNSRENISNYFSATNQNFYSSAVNFNSNNINSNFYSSKNNILGFEKTVSSNNIFSLTTVNNFNPNNLNINSNNNNQIQADENVDHKVNLHYNNHNHLSPIPKVHQNLNSIGKNTSGSISKIKSNTKMPRYEPPNTNYKSKQTFAIKKPQNKSQSPLKAKGGKREEKQFLSELNEEENIKNNIKTVLYNAKAFMEKLNLVEVTVYMRNKKLFVEVNPISLLTEKIFILCFENKEDRNMISKVFKDYQSFVNNLYYDFPKIEVRTKHPMNYISNWYLKEDLKKIEDERNKIMLLN